MIWHNPHSSNASGPERGGSFEYRGRGSDDPLPLTATPLEVRNITRLLAQPPPPNRISPEIHLSIINEVRQLVRCAQNQPRLVHTDILNGLVQQSLTKYCLQNGLRRWNLVKMEDHLRSGTDRTYTFGQVTDRGQECFIGLWHVCHETHRALIGFRIGVVPELIAVRRECNLPREYLRFMTERGPRPWEHQVHRDSELGEWLIQVFGTKTLGYFPQYRPLGVFTDGVRAFADSEGISHLLLPRSRRDPGTKPWHVGAFMRFDGERFVWSGWGLRDGITPTLLTVGVRPNCEILQLKPLK